MRKTVGIKSKQKLISSFTERQNDIVMKDWAGTILFQGSCDSGQVDRILRKNKCKHCDGQGAFPLFGDDYKDETECTVCDGTRYSGDFSVHWVDSSDARNVYEYINY